MLSRGKDTRGRWVYGDLVMINDRAHILPRMEFDPTQNLGAQIERRLVPVLLDTLGKFIGLHDLNRECIFTGDLVSTTEGIEQVTRTWEGRGTVIGTIYDRERDHTHS